MGTFSIWHWLIVLAVVLILFGGGGKLSRLMGDLGKGLKSFKRNISDDSADEDDRRRIASERNSGEDEHPAPEKEKAARR